MSAESQEAFSQSEPSTNFQNTGSTATQNQRPPQNFSNSPPLLQIADYLLISPSIPQELRQSFHALWESATLGNFGDRGNIADYDIKKLELMFDEWCILLMMYMPDCEWGNALIFKESSGSSVSSEKVGNEYMQRVDGGYELRIDLNMLINMLKSEYYIRLTRGRGGFATKELTTFRMRNTMADETIQQEKKGFRFW